ncbi:transcriptional regulator [Caulobacter sp. AP07]|uniref:MarR family transcriptional regulator n=1 Tax=Caulobacter sp. AP07 TaxID=1144304 RepID=UPI000271E8C6|nr:MarR family transcriptional regulator [Caulobacter sp. AP07]EJL30769.1 transcriptional regulator [Caulobacter sp. AP07]
MSERRLLPYNLSLAGTLLAAREAVMAPIRPYLREAGLTDQQWRVLRVLADEGDLDPTRLAQAALLYPPSVTRIVRELAERGLIERRADVDDRRRIILALRPEGLTLVKLTAIHTLALLDLYAERFGRERLARLRTELADFTTAIGAATGVDEDH